MSRWLCRFSRHDFLKRGSIAHRDMNMYQHDGCWWCCYLCCWVLDPGKSAAIDSRLNRRMFQVGGFSSTKRWWQLPRSASTKLLLFILPIFHSDSLLFFFFFFIKFDSHFLSARQLWIFALLSQRFMSRHFSSSSIRVFLLYWSHFL